MAETNFCHFNEFMVHDVIRRNIKLYFLMLRSRIVQTFFIQLIWTIGSIFNGCDLVITVVTIKDFMIIYYKI